MLKVWGRENSINVQKVLWCCEELALPYQRLDVGGPYGGLDTPEYLRLNPNRLIPTIEDGDFVLWESNSIVRYLAAKHDPGGLYPDDLPSRADAERWMDWQLSVMNPPFVTLFLGLVRTPPEKRNKAAIDDAIRRVAEAWVLLDAHLEGRSHPAGERLTIADIAIGGFAYRWFNLPLNSPPLKRVRAWYETLTRRQAFAKSVMLPIT